MARKVRYLNPWVPGAILFVVLGVALSNCKGGAEKVTQDKRSLHQSGLINEDTIGCISAEVLDEVFEASRLAGNVRPMAVAVVKGVCRPVDAGTKYTVTDYGIIKSKILLVTLDGNSFSVWLYTDRLRY